MHRLDAIFEVPKLSKGASAGIASIQHSVTGIGINWDGKDALWCLHMNRDELPVTTVATMSQ